MRTQTHLQLALPQAPANSTRGKGMTRELEVHQKGLLEFGSRVNLAGEAQFCQHVHKLIPGIINMLSERWRGCIV